jgi:hypothetical protein
MCHGDIALTTYDWIPDYKRPWPNFQIEHECRNWDAIFEWIKAHSIESLRGPILQHPDLGGFPS